MPTDNVHRTLTLRSAISNSRFGAENGGPGTLGAVLELIHGQLSTIRQRRARFDGQVVEGRNLHDDGKGVHLLHFVAYTPNDKISVVPRAGDKSAADLELIDPPENAEFLDGELMILVKDNDVAVCRSGLGERAFVAYIADLAERCGLDRSDTSFQLVKRADIDKLVMVQREGIKRLSMNSVAHAASIDRAQRETVKENIVGHVWDELKALFGIEEKVPDDAENLKVEVLFTFDKRRGTDIDQRQLAYLAERMLAEDEEEGFFIETLEGRKVRANEIVLSKSVRVPAYGKSISHLEAWGQLRAFYDELRRAPRQERQDG